jgi:(E)-4-hydroxy-3-methylbut-2-enyl-diphosphate synthase
MDIQLTYHRRHTTTTKVGSLEIGSEYPVRIQTMANTSTNDIEGSVAQAERCMAAGTELLRYTTQGIREVESLAQIHQRLIASSPHGPIAPLVADIHFQSDVADAAAKVVEKVRINPGNYIDPARKFKQIDYTDDEYQSELERLRKRFTQLLNI